MSENTEVMIREDSELSIQEVQVQVHKVQELMRSVMQENEHFGVIPGTQKPTLLKPGAEKLCFTFRLIPEFEVRRYDLPNGHREYETVCTLRHMKTGAIAGMGVGTCSSMESKYRWRNDYTSEPAGPVPGNYWSVPKENFAGRNRILESTYGPGKYRTKKIEGQWTALKITGDGNKVENPDIADTYNTILKMSNKRALVAATINATAASDIFTQDLEDNATPVPPKGNGSGKGSQKGKGTKEAPPTQPKSARQEILDEIATLIKNNDFPEPEKKLYRDELKKAGEDDTKLKEVLDEVKKAAAYRKKKDTMMDPGLDAAFEGRTVDEPAAEEEEPTDQDDLDIF